MNENESDNPYEGFDFAELGDVSDLDTIAISLHEIFQSYMRAGFTESQSIDLVSRIVLRGLDP